MLELTVNGRKHTLEIDPGTPLLWALRDHLHLRGRFHPPRRTGEALLVP